MRRHKSHTLQWHFMTKSLLVSLLVLSVTLLALFRLASSYYAYTNQTRNIEIARAIDNIAMVTATPAHVQQFVDSSIRDDAHTVIRVIGKRDGKIIATNRPSEYQSGFAELPDPEFRAVVNRALKTGAFYPNLITKSGRNLTVLPLTSARHALAGNFVLQQANALKPAWHRTLRPSFDGPANWLARLFGAGPPGSATVFTMPPARFSGVMLIESRKPWAGSLISSAVYSTAMLIISGFIAVVLSGWYVCQRNVIAPIKELSDVLKQQRTGKPSARAGRSSVTEFDRFARQWNGLLNHRQSAEERNRVLSKVLETAPIGIEVSSPDALVEYANPAYLKMTGYSLIDVIGKTPHQLLGTENADHAVVQAANQAMSQGRFWQGEILTRRKNGSEFMSGISLCPIMTGEGKLERVIAVRQDITERKEYERNLIEARQKSQAAGRSKTEFITRMSHELRTPFNAIIGFADIIAKQQLGPVGNASYIEFATIIEQSATGLLGIINSIIDLSRLAAGQRPLDDAPVNLNLLAARVTRAHHEQADRENITFEIHDQLDGHGLRADERLLEHLLANLVSNAVKFNTKDGRVDITLRRDRDNRIILQVADTGIGIEESQWKNVLKPFVQLNPGYEREHQGIGLGLTLAENQAAAHAAELKISSCQEGGTCIDLVFPAERTIKPAGVQEEPAGSATRNAA